MCKGAQILTTEKRKDIFKVREHKREVHFKSKNIEDSEWVAYKWIVSFKLAFLGYWEDRSYSTHFIFKLVIMDKMYPGKKQLGLFRQVRKKIK